MTVIISVFDKDSFELSGKLFSGIDELFQKAFFFCLQDQLFIAQQKTVFTILLHVKLAQVLDCLILQGSDHLLWLLNKVTTTSSAAQAFKALRKSEP